MNSKSKSEPSDRCELSIVIPVLNEAESLQELHAEICRICEQNQLTFEAIYVDDGSHDNSFAVLENLFAKDRRIKAIQLRKNMGKSEALAA